MSGKKSPRPRLLLESEGRGAPRRRDEISGGGGNAWSGISLKRLRHRSGACRSERNRPARTIELGVDGLGVKCHLESTPRGKVW